jgi:hypothetical protein
VDFEVGQQKLGGEFHRSLLIALFYFLELVVFLFHPITHGEGVTL